MTLDGSCLLAFPFLGRLLVELATTKLRQDAGFLAGTLEPTQGCVEVLIFFYTNAWHTNYCQYIRYKETRREGRD